MKKVCCIFNYGPHYDFPLYKEMDIHLSCNFYIGDHLQCSIKNFDYSQLSGYRGTLHNIFLRKFYWQKGSPKLLFADYDYYILTGELYNLSNWVILLLSKFTKKKIVGWTHGWYGRESFIKRILKKWYYCLFDSLLVYNDYSIRLMEEQGIPRRKMYCFANSLDSDIIKNIREHLKESTVYHDYFGNNNPVLIYCGRIQKRKKLDMLVNSIEMLKQKGCNTNLVIVGADNENTGINELIKQKDLESQVWLYGPCFDENVLGELFYNASICISPGNVGLTAIHSLSYGCPVITHGDFPYQMPEFEAIIPNKTGAFFQRDSIEDLTQTILSWLQHHTTHREEVRKLAYEEIDRKWNIHYQINILNSVLQ